jgi:hypothetical protein
VSIYLDEARGNLPQEESMLGFLIGAACLFGLVKVLRGGRRWHGYGGWGHGGYGGFRGGYGFRGGGGRWFLRALFERLETTPGQEKVILQELDQLRENKRAVHEELEQIRRDIARALRTEAFDQSALDEAYGRQDALLTKLRAQFSVALSKVHEALDDRQRKQIGDWLEGGGFFGGGPRWGGHGPFGGGPYRNVWA